MQKKTFAVIAVAAVVVVAGALFVALRGNDSASTVASAPKSRSPIIAAKAAPAPKVEQGNGEVVMVSPGNLGDIIDDGFAKLRAEYTSKLEAMSKELAAVKNRQYVLNTETVKNKIQDRFASPPSAPLVTPESRPMGRQDVPVVPMVRQEVPVAPIARTEQLVPPPLPPVRVAPPANWPGANAERRPRFVPVEPVRKGSLEQWEQLSLKAKIVLVKEICDGRVLPEGYTEQDVVEKYKYSSYDEVVDMLEKNCGYRSPTGQRRLTAEDDDQQPYKVAGNVNVRANVGLYPPRGQGYRQRDDRWSTEDDSQLDGMLERKAIQMFGPPTTNGYKFTGVHKDFKPVRPGCTERREDTPRGTMVRVVCR